MAPRRGTLLFATLWLWPSVLLAAGSLESVAAAARSTTQRRAAAAAAAAASSGCGVLWGCAVCGGTPQYPTCTTCFSPEFVKNSDGGCSEYLYDGWL
jgi:hypothetical protein